MPPRCSAKLKAKKADRTSARGMPRSREGYGMFRFHLVAISASFLVLATAPRAAADATLCIEGPGGSPDLVDCDDNLIVGPPNFLPFGSNGDFAPALGADEVFFAGGGTMVSGIGIATVPPALPLRDFTFTGNPFTLPGIPAFPSTPAPAFFNPGGAFTGMAYLTSLGADAGFTASDFPPWNAAALPLLPLTLTAACAGCAVYFPLPSAGVEVKLEVQTAGLCRSFHL